MGRFRITGGALAALALAGAMSAQPASADDLSPGAAAAVGALGGLAIGTILGAQAAQPAYPPPPVYAPPPPEPRVYRSRTVIVERPAPVYERECFTDTRRVWRPGWGWERTRRTVCR